MNQYISAKEKMRQTRIKIQHDRIRMAKEGIHALELFLRESEAKLQELLQELQEKK